MQQIPSLFEIELFVLDRALWPIDGTVSSAASILLCDVVFAVFRSEQILPFHHDLGVQIGNAPSKLIEEQLVLHQLPSNHGGQFELNGDDVPDQHRLMDHGVTVAAMPSEPFVFRVQFHSDSQRSFGRILFDHEPLSQSLQHRVHSAQPKRVEIAHKLRAFGVIGPALLHRLGPNVHVDVADAVLSAMEIDVEHRSVDVADAVQLFESVQCAVPRRVREPFRESVVWVDVRRLESSKEVPDHKRGRNLTRCHSLLQYLTRGYGQFECQCRSVPLHMVDLRGSTLRL